MRIGINYPWFNYGWDFGPTPPGWGPRAAWRDAVDTDFAAFARSGISIVRWFILADGSNFGFDDAAPRRDVLRWRWRQVPAMDPAMLDDFEALLDRCRYAGVQLLPVLIDFSWGFPGHTRNSKHWLHLRLWRSTRAHAQRLPTGMVKGGRADVFRNPNLRQQFFQRVLEPLLERCERYRPVIYAWELINEPEWITRGAGGWLNPIHRIALSDMLTFLHSGTEIIRDHGFRSSIGFASQRTLRRWERRGKPPRNSAVSALGTDLDQYHYYGRLGRGPIPALVDNPRPTLLGEFGTRMPGTPAFPGLTCSSLTEDHWPDMTQQTLTARLLRAQALGYEAAFAWAYRSRDCRTAIDREAMLRAIALAAESG